MERRRIGSQWLRSLSARMVLVNMAVTTGMSVLMILALCVLAEKFMHAHLDDTVLDEVHMLEAELNIDGLRGVASLINQRIAAYPSGRQAYLLVDQEGRKLAGNLDAEARISEARPSWLEYVPLQGMINSTLRSNVQPASNAGNLAADVAARRNVGTWHSLPTLYEPSDAMLRLRRTRLSDGSHLVVGFDDHEIEVFVDSLQRAAAFGFGLTVVLGFMAGALSTRLTLKQIETINRTANQIIAGDLNQRVPLRNSGDEFDRLGTTLNEMLDRINELMNSVRYASESIAHDLRSPLTRMRYRIEATHAVMPMEPQQQKEFIDGIGTEVDRVLTVFSSLLRLATIESGVLRSGFQQVTVAALVDDAVSLYEALASDRDISLPMSISDAVRALAVVDGDRDLLFQAICNLLDNAIKFSPDHAEVHLDMVVAPGWMTLRIRDQGPGIPEDQRDRVFERLVRLDSSRNSPGFGLGLSLVRGIAHLHHGECHLLDGAPGTVAVLELPLAG